jgi:hypothetical protein
MAELTGSRLSRVRASHSYGIVLILIIAVFAFIAIAPDDSWADSTLLLLECAVLVTALWTSGLAQADSKISLTLVASAAAAAIALLIVGGNGLAAVVGLLSGVLAVATILVIALGVADQGEANVKAVTGAICVYVLIGIVFIFIYGVIAILGSGDFFAQGTDGTRSLRLYFSFVTLGTLGYGDYTAAGELARTLAIVETLFGQLYLVTVIAVLVARMRGGGRAAD